jgi:medium-chain acyl-[acyl-carrier-protein] hydrolase
MKSDPEKPWITRPRPNPGAALRVLCFPYAGGGSSVFRTWPGELPENVELWVIELPGRETRAKERPLRLMTELITQLTSAVAPLLKPPFALYGHSLGALTGFRFARELRRRGGPQPVHLFVSGRRAPQLPEPSPMHGLPDAQFTDRLRRMGGVSEAVLAEPELMAYFLPIIRADISLVEGEAYVEEPPLAVPITALGGLADEKASVAELEAWRTQTSAGFEHEMFPGGHFFIQTARPAFLGALSRHLTRVTAAP